MWSGRASARRDVHSSKSNENEAGGNEGQAEEKSNKKEQAAIEKPGKKEKIRFGQKPRETLPAATADESTKPAIEDAGAFPRRHPTRNEPVNPLDRHRATRASGATAIWPSNASTTKRQEKKKQTDTFTATPPTPAEVADREMQSTSLGLGGKATAKKKEKNRGTKEQKTRFSQQKKKPETPPVFTPAPPVQGAPAPGNAPKAEPSSTTSTPQQ